jgi:hypothetical protein
MRGFAVRPPILYFQGALPNTMNITISHRVKRFEFLDLVNLETDIGVGVNRRPRSPAQIDQLVILLHPVEFDPADVMFHGVGMGNLMAHDDPDDVLAFLVTLINDDARDVFFFALILARMDILGQGGRATVLRVKI